MLPDSNEIGRPAGPLTLAWVLPEWVGNLLLTTANAGFPDPEKVSRVQTLFEAGAVISVPLMDSKSAKMEGIYFVNGRHRASHLIALGAKRIPVCLPVDVMNSLPCHYQATSNFF